MRVGFGITALARGLARNGIDGIGSYTRALMQQLVADPGIELIPVSYGGYPLPVLPDRAGSPLIFSGYKYLGVLSAVSGCSFIGSKRLESRVDLVHAPDHYIPEHRGLPVVATIMDAIPLSNPDWVSPRIRRLKNILWKRSARRPSQIITISEYSRQQITRHFAIAEDKIHIIPLGVEKKWFQTFDPAIADVILKKYRLSSPYFIFVGTLQPRKNVARIISAYQSLPKAIRNDVPLVIVGQPGWCCDDLIETLTASAVSPSLRWLRHLPDADLQVVFKQATALVFPSLHEGFGLSVLEAFAAGVPVITSNTTALPEVAADAAMLINPLDTEEIASAMQAMLEQPELADHFRHKGQQRAQLYSWSRTASMTIDVYKQALGRA